MSHIAILSRAILSSHRVPYLSPYHRVSYRSHCVPHRQLTVYSISRRITVCHIASSCVILPSHRVAYRHLTVCNIIILPCAISSSHSVPYRHLTVCHIVISLCAISQFHCVPYRHLTMCHIVISPCAISPTHRVPYRYLPVFHIAISPYAISPTHGNVLLYPSYAKIVKNFLS